MTAAPLLRVALLLILAAIVILPARSSGAARATGPVWLPDAPFEASTHEPVYDSLLVGRAPRAVVRASAAPPSAAELDVLGAAARRAPLLVALPPAVRTIRIEPPITPRAGRAAALSFHLLGSPGDSLWVRLADETGVLDSVRVVIDSVGVARGGFRLRPSRAGWHEWTVEAGDRTARAGAWVRESRPIRVLVAAGPPTWESRFIVRALEEARVEVELVQPLGRGLFVGDGPRALPTAIDALADYDVVLVLAGADAGPNQLRALRDYAATRGGGVLLTGAAADGAFGVAAADTDADVSGDSIRWLLPPELVPLPAADIRAAASILAAGDPLVRDAAVAPAGSLLALRPTGRGRVAVIGLVETWRWRMQAGRESKHREFWRSMVEWLADGVRAPFVARVDAPLGPTRERVGVDVFVYATPEDSAAPRLSVIRPDGRTESLPLSPDPGRPNAHRSAFVPARAGVYSLAVDGEPVGGFHAVADVAPAPNAWARLALLADRSGGAAVAGDTLEEIVRQRMGDAAPSRDLPSRPILFGLLVALAMAEWAIRRLSGRP